MLSSSFYSAGLTKYTCVFLTPADSDYLASHHIGQGKIRSYDPIKTILQLCKLAWAPPNLIGLIAWACSCVGHNCKFEVANSEINVALEPLRICGRSRGSRNRIAQEIPKLIDWRK